MKIDLTLVSLPEFTVSSNTNLSTAKFSEDAYFPKRIRLPRIEHGTKTDYLPFQVRLTVQGYYRSLTIKTRQKGGSNFSF